MNYKKAFKCKNCPKNNGEQGCPMWWELMLQNQVTQEQKIEKACGYTLLPQLMINMLADTFHSTKAAYDMRNQVVKNIGKVIVAVKDKLELPDIDVSKDGEVVLLEDKTEE